MASLRKRSVTLIELIIAIILVAVIILGVNGVSYFSHNHAISADRRAKVQNDISYCLDRISKEGLKAIGNETIFGSNTVVLVVPNLSIAFFIDGNSDGRKDTTNDYWVKYTYNSSNYQLSYCSNCGSSSLCASCNTEILSGKITAFKPTKDFTLGNHVEVEISGRWDPVKSPSIDNPEVKMRAAIQLPSVSTN